MMKPLILLTFFAALICIAPPLHSQDNCPVIVQTALEATNTLCADTARNQLCYGNSTLHVEPFDRATGLQFESPGDIVDLYEVRSLALNPMNAETGEWGMGLMRLQANLPDTLPGQNVTFILIGDTSVERVDSGDDTISPMQIFYFRSGIGDAPCAEAPQSGLLVQTPQGNRRVDLTINEVNINIGSTIFLQAEPDGLFAIYVLEGEISIETFDVSRSVSAGQRVTIPLDDALHPNGEPAEPQSYDARELSNLPIGLLEHPITIADEFDHEDEESPQDETITMIIGHSPEIDFDVQGILDPFCMAEPESSGHYLTLASYGFDPEYPELHEEGLSPNDLFNLVSFELTVNGEIPSTFGERYMMTNSEGTHIQQLYDLGHLETGTYVIRLNTSVNGQHIVTETCTYTLED